MGLFLDFMSSLRVAMNSILILLNCRNRVSKEAYPTEQLVENIEEFEDELQFDQKFQETLLAVREQRRMWPSIREMVGKSDDPDDSRFAALFRNRGRAGEEENGPGGNNDHTDYGLWTLSWNNTPRFSPLGETTEEQTEEVAQQLPIEAVSRVEAILPKEVVAPQQQEVFSPETREINEEKTEISEDGDFLDIDPPLKLPDYDDPPIATITYCWDEEEWGADEKHARKNLRTDNL